MVSQPFTSSLGTDDELSALIQEAQSRGINIGPALSLSTSKDELLTNLKARLAAESRPEVQALRAEAAARTAGNPFLSALFGQGERPSPEQAFYGAPGTGLGANPLFQTYINPSVTENLPEPVQLAIGQVANPIGTISAVASPLRTAGAVGGSVLAQQVAKKAGAGPGIQNIAGLAGAIAGGTPELPLGVGRVAVRGGSAVVGQVRPVARQLLADERGAIGGQGARHLKVQGQQEIPIPTARDLIRRDVIADFIGRNTGKYIYHTSGNVEGVIDNGLKAGGYSSSPFIEQGYGDVVHVFRREDFIDLPEFHPDVRYPDIASKYKTAKPIASFTMEELGITPNMRGYGARAQELGLERDPPMPPEYEERYRTLALRQDARLRQRIAEAYRSRSDLRAQGQQNISGPEVARSFQPSNKEPYGPAVTARPALPPSAVSGGLATQRPGNVLPPPPPAVPPSQPLAPPPAMSPGGRTPAQKFVDFLNSQNPRALERQTNLARRGALSTKAAGVSEALGGNLPTEAAFRAARAAQRGELPKAVFEPAAQTGKGFIPETVRPDLFDQPDIENLYDTVRNSNLQPFDKQNAADALTKALLGELPAPHEIRYLRNVFGDSFGDALMRHRSFGPKAWDTAVEAANIPRTLFQTVLDFSGLLRQGAVLAAARPFRSLKTAPEFIRPLFSEKYFNTIQESIRTDALYPRAQTAKLFIAETSSDIATREEAFISRLAQKIPLWGKIVRSSERSYVGGLNKLRFDSFKDSLRGWANQGLTSTPEMEEQLATVLNYATGRGSLGPANRAAPVLSAVFYSPRFLASRIELPFEDLRNLQRAGQAAIAGDPKLAAAYAGLARNTVAFVGAGMTILTLLKLREDGKELNVESDARSPDFGRIRYRHTRFDFWSGYQPITRYTWQVIVQKTKSLPEAKSPGKLNTAQGSDIVARFLRSKLAPAPGLAADILNRRTISGQELSPSAETAGQLAYREFVPFFVTSLNDAAQQYGAKYSLLGLPSAAGVSVDTYNPKRPALRAGLPYRMIFPAR